MSESAYERLTRLTPDDRSAFLRRLPPERLAQYVNREWPVIARPEQLPPWDEDWRWLLWMAGRFFGKTRSGAEATLDRTKWLAGQLGGAPFQYGLVSRRLKDVRNTMMEGPSGLRSIIPPSLLVAGSWERSFNRGAVELKLTNGTEIRGYSSEAPDDITGSGLAGAWVDEIASLRDAKAGRYQMGTFYHLDAALREGPDPRGLLTGTPRNNRLMRELVEDPAVRIVRGSTYDNLANAPATYREFVLRYAGTRLGRQELGGELLTDVGVMFSRSDLEDPDRLLDAPLDGKLRRARAWDLASSVPGDTNPDPDWTVGVRMAFVPGDRLWIIEHVERFRERPGSRDDRIKDLARRDRLRVQHVEQYRGAAGLDIIAGLNRHLNGVARVKGLVPAGTKAERADHLAGVAEQGRLRIVRGPWLEALVDEFEEFPDGAHDDIVDAAAMAMRALGERPEAGDPSQGQPATRRAPQAPGAATRVRPGGRLTSAR